MSKKLLFFLFIATLTVISCNDNKEPATGDTWISGEIVNPKNDFIYITRNKKVLDTVKLDNNNFFSYQFKDPEAGIYFFNHNEYQTVFVEPGDSILLRVNTIEFDESLSFSGKGGEKNNLLMRFFLLNEKEAPLLARYYQLPPAEFETKVDSLKKKWEKIYNGFLAKYDPSETFKEIAQSNIDYIYYMRKELYTAAHANKNTLNPIIYPAGFYAYRDKIDMGNELLRTTYPYYRFLNFYLDNLAHEKREAKTHFNRLSFAHNYAKLRVIDSVITNDSLKNDLLKYNVRRYLLNAKNAENEEKIIALFEETSTNTQHIKRMKKLAEATMQLTPNHSLPNLELVTTNNTLVQLKEVIKNPTVFYFWSVKSARHNKTIHLKVAELKSKFPEYDYIGINTDTNFKKWLNMVKKQDYDLSHEYQFEDIGQAEKKLVLTSVNKALIVDKNGKILEGNTNLLSTEIEEQLLGYINK
ncbi:TlpA family protein disulfide reductase [Marixanthomonas spongiae]|uniref:TlpA family protein disulfide reductase n=1 Tax=Marixanthomonas spongiae TaxID=2174845 RepID=UPI00105823DF|nr:thioredoxin-like domain-containing protein [Marixanthomonas spongiae]